MKLLIVLTFRSGTTTSDDYFLVLYERYCNSGIDTTVLCHPDVALPYLLMESFPQAIPYIVLYVNRVLKHDSTERFATLSSEFKL